MKLVLQCLLIVSLLAFGLDLFHMIFHLAQNPRLWRIEGVPVKFLMKIILSAVPLIFILRRKIWLRGFAFALFFAVVQPSLAFAGKSSRCEHARELLSQSGMARDASENLFGNIKTKPPYGSFPEDMDKITWWGAFQPFEFWESPEFKAVWINPEGEEIESRKFKPGHCRLAKTSLKGENQPRGQFQPGMWNVLVTCEDYLIDKQSFAVLPSGPAPTGPDAAAGSKPETAMIWAKDEVK